MYAFGIGSGRFTRASGKVGVNENDGTRRSRGTDGSNPVPSTRESVANLVSSIMAKELGVSGDTPLAAVAKPEMPPGELEWRLFLFTFGTGRDQFSAKI